METDDPTQPPEDQPKDAFERWMDRHPAMGCLGMLGVLLGFFGTPFAMKTPGFLLWCAERLALLPGMSMGDAFEMLSPAFRPGLPRFLVHFGLMALGVPLALLALYWSLWLLWRWWTPIFYTACGLAILIRLFEDPGQTVLIAAGGAVLMWVVNLVHRHFANQQAILEELRRRNGRPPEGDI